MIKLENFDNVEAPSVDYPYGSIKNDDGTLNGTPLNREVLSDMFQFFAKLSDLSDLTINDLPDNDVNGFQLYSALLRSFPKKFVKTVNTDFDGYTITITKSDLDNAFYSGFPFYAGGGAVVNYFVDFTVTVWRFDSPMWREVPLHDFDTVFPPGEVLASASVDGSNGDVIITLSDGVVLPSPVEVRVVLIG